MALGVGEGCYCLSFGTCFCVNAWLLC